jgi:hypothetical protein
MQLQKGLKQSAKLRKSNDLIFKIFKKILYSAYIQWHSPFKETGSKSSLGFFCLYGQIYE